MTISIDTTRRGFPLVKFYDTHDRACGVQKSSADGDYIWIGCDEIGLKRFTPGEGWRDIFLETGGVIHDSVSYIANTKMHLTREQVAELLPLLTRFVETGDLS
jgi:hypothetical protein